MKKNEIIDLLKTNNKSGSKTREEYFKKNLNDEYLKIVAIDFVDTWYEKLYSYLNNLIEPPKCLKIGCNNVPTFISYSTGYSGYCCVKCKNSDINFINNNKLNYLKKYGVDNPLKRIEVVNKIKTTKKERYGNENYVNLKKGLETKKERYGNENYNNRKKSIKTSLEKHGVTNFTNRDKAKETSLLKYGDQYYNNREKQFLSNLEKYGTKIYNNREKSIETCQEKYGKNSYSQTDESKLKQYIKTNNKWAEKLNISINDLIYDGNDFIINNYCKLHQSFIINKDVLKNRIIYGIENFCTLCNPVSEHSSIKEIELRKFIEEDLNIKTNKIRIENKEIDIFIPSSNLGIEFNGLYWHSHVNIESNFHLNKTELCKKNNIQLLHIFEHEWINKKEIVKSIIKSKLGIINNKIFARKCIIKEIDSKDSSIFLNSNHIQGNVNSSIKLGLFYNEELVCIMTFGKKRIAMGNKNNVDGEYEMLRFCNKLNTVVVGGASKLFKYFIINYKPKQILSFADRRYSEGNLYKQLGFEFIANTAPNYWYFKSHEYILYHRFTFRKNILVSQGFDAQKTEHQIMDERGYYRIYDSGNMKFIFKLE